MGFGMEGGLDYDWICRSTVYKLPLKLVQYTLTALEKTTKPPVKYT